jgi:hypothetical protein
MNALYVITGVRHSVVPASGEVSIYIENTAEKMMKQLRQIMRTDPAMLAHFITQGKAELTIDINPFFPVTPEVARPIIFSFMRIFAGENYKERDLRILEVSQIIEGWT